jgi:phosphonate transport system substrate-binding protein
MEKTFIRWVGAVAACLSMGLAQAQEVLSFGVIASAGVQNLKVGWEPLLDDMRKRTGLNVQAFYARENSAIIEAVKSGKVHMGFGKKTAIDTIDAGASEVFAVAVNADGTKGYNSVLIANKSSPLKNLDDVLKNSKTLRLGLGDVNSTSGFVAPVYYIFVDRKIDPQAAFVSVVNQNHEKNALAVANRVVDVATNNSEDLVHFAENYPEKFKDLKVIWTSPSLPLDPLFMRKDLPAATKAKIKSFFLSYGKMPEEKANLMEINKLSGYAPSDDKMLDPVRLLAFAGERFKVLANASLSANEKAGKVAELDRRIAALKP